MADKFVPFGKKDEKSKKDGKPATKKEMPMKKKKGC